MPPSGLSRAYVLAAATAFAWGLFEALEISFVEPEVRFFWVKMQAIGFGGVGAAWLVFMLELARHPVRKSRWLKTALIIIYVACLAAVWTNPLHGEFYLVNEYSDGSFPPGTLFWVVAGLQYCLLAIGYVVGLTTALTSRSLRHSSEPVIFIVAGAMPAAGVLLREAGVVPWHLDGPAVLVYTLLLFYVLRNRQPGLKGPLSLDVLLDNLDAALVGFTPGGRLVDANRKLEEIFGKRFAGKTGRPSSIEELLAGLDPLEPPPELDSLRSLASEPLKEPLVISFRLRPEGRYWARLEMHPLWVRKRLAGYLMELQDVSEVSRLTRSLRHRESELAMAHAELEKAHAQLGETHAELAQRAKALESAVEANAQQIREQHQQLVHAQKMESLGRLAGGISHDFNNVLFSLIGYADLIIADPTDSEEARYCAEKIKTGAERAAELTRKLLGFARRSKPRLEETDVGDLAEEVMSLLTRTVEPRVKFKLRKPDGLPSILGDASQLHQVLMNVALNAVEAIESSGEVVMTLQGPTELSRASGAVGGPAPRGSYVRLQISDTGSGMSEETQKRIFEPFFTTKSRGKGTGLGLSLVYGIIQEHGGAISVHSRLDHGTRFEIYLRVFEGAEERGPSDIAAGNGDAGRPAGRTCPDVVSAGGASGRGKAPEPGAGEGAGDGAPSGRVGAQREARRTPAPTDPRGKVFKTFTGIETRRGKLGILVIDDNPEVLALCRRYFAEPLFDVWTAASGRQGAEILEHRSGEVDVILLDLILPDGAPEEVFTSLRSIKPQVVTVVMSGYHTDERVSKLLEMGAQKFLKKPFSRKELRAAVRHIIEQ
jgi:signal transduction histidine kinase